MNRITTFLLVISLFLSFLLPQKLQAQTPWPAGQCGILDYGIAAITCGVSTNQMVDDRYTFALVNSNGAVPAMGRDTAMQDVYYHPSWRVDSIGNVYGIELTPDGRSLLTASSNYGSGYWGQTAVLSYGEIGGALTNMAQAAGTIYEIDNLTGQASPWSVLPQQLTSIDHYDCEVGTTVNRPSTGVGLGNIAYDEVNDQYFVTNIEDGRIYRLNATGTILDSYDPFDYDDGAAGITTFDSLVYGIVVEPGSGRVLFGGTYQDTQTAGNTTNGSPKIYSIDLTGLGGFSGTVDNTNLPTGATYDNYVGAEEEHATIITGGANTFGTNTNYLISDLEFNNAGDLLAGVRVGCQNSFHTSYNHHGETNKLTLNGTSGLYESPQEYDISVLGDIGPEDGYGGVAVNVMCDGTEVYAVSSADIIEESGPHGIAFFNGTAATGTSVDPLGVVSYGTVDETGNGDPKGIGGEIDIFDSRKCPVVCTASNDGPGCTGGSVTLSSSAGGNTYAWTGPDGFISADQNPVILNLAAANAGIYMVVVTDAAGCTSAACSTTLVVADPPTLMMSGNDISCNGLTDGTASVVASGNGMFTYLWSNSASSADLIGLSAATYTVTVTDTNGCTDEGSFTVNEPNAIVLDVNVTDETNCAAQDGTITATATNGLPAYQFSLDNGISQATGDWTAVTNGSHVVQVTDASGCTSTQTVIVNPSTLLNVTLTGTDVTCGGGGDGAISASVEFGSGNYEFSIDNMNFQAASTFSDLAAGTYTVYVNDLTNPTCQETAMVTLSEPAVFEITSLGETNPLGCLTADGTLTVATVGGNGTVFYSLNGGTPQISNSYTGLVAGEYTVVITDLSGCTDTQTVTLADPSAPEIAPTSTNATCNGDSDATIFSFVTGGSGNFEYSLDNMIFQASSSFPNLPAGSYTVYVNDLDRPGCSDSAPITVQEPPLIDNSSVATDILCNGDTDGTITITASNGSGTYTYSLGRYDLSKLKCF